MSEKLIEITTPLSEETVRGLKAGDRVRLSGIVYTGRDAAHARLVELLEKGEDLPFPPEGAVIYYVGPAPAKPPRPIGSAGPTTSYRMDPYTPPLLKVGVRGMIGKGLRGMSVVEAMKTHGAVYFAAIGGAAAYIAKSIVSAEVIAYEDLGTEAIRRLEVADFPLVVAQDSHGRSAYEDGKREYRSIELG
ncbi:Fe-S-containing hydro-lyase [bacterium]|nr:Fe-S-containing hydro-lyase [bacterium]